MSKHDFSTRLIHPGRDRDPYTGASSIPIYQVSTFHQNDPEHLGRYDYARSDNPTREALEIAIAGLEGGSRGFAFASGMAATASVMMTFQTGDHLVVGEDIYGGTYRILTTVFQRWGLATTFVDSTDLDQVRAAITPKTKAIFIETPSNPTLKITDLAAVAQIAHDHGLLALTDNTFMSPALQRPLELGFDVVVHSATKFIGGHSDLIAGLAVVKDAELGRRVRHVQNAFGAILGPQDSWLTLRGLKTLDVRLRRQQESAALIADWLQARKEVKKVYYPSLSGHPGREVHLRQASGGGAVVSFELETGPQAVNLMKQVKLPLVGVSLGGVESILSYPATMSHAAMPEKERAARGITAGLVRLSVGLESAADLLQDLDQALAQA
ncbi:MAG: cystathionine gamma-synthase [Lentisphaerae bacterium RIFOXYB12_FULL_65_16]|nr:MAG: cystathionine gamma-synthase [Lentisphaerae bacterium RIFOXYA12_64_32]OGV90418.1 MAG: cystathionine gamma-synthase [Lentisphaerae bacterium RIFOXYB12_FULL_65_16]